MRRWLLIYILLFSVAPAFAQQDAASFIHLSIDSVANRERTLSNSWHYHSGDNMAMAQPDYNDSAWALVHTGHYNNENKNLFPSKEALTKDINWFRLHVVIDSTLLHVPLTLKLNVRGAAEIYINGKRGKLFGRVAGKDSVLYYSGDDDFYTFNFSRVGDNVIAIRYAYYKQEGETYKNDEVVAFKTSIGEANFVARNNSVLRNIRDVLLSFFSGIFGVLAGLFFLFWIYRSRDWSNLLACILFIAISIIIRVFNSAATSSITDADRTENLIIALALIAFVALNGFLHVIFGKLSKGFFVRIGLVLVASIAYATSDSFGYIVALVVFGIILIDTNILMVRAMKQKVKGSMVLGIPIIMLLICSILAYPSIFIIENLPSSNSLSEVSTLQIVAIVIFLVFIFLAAVSILSVPISITIFLAKRFANVSNELSAKLIEVQTLSEKTIAQEQEKKRILENQKHQLELEVEERTREIVEEKKKSDDLLLNILPAEVAEELKENGSTKAKHFDHVSVLFTDFVDFTKTGERLSPEELVNELDTCFKAFDEICARHDIEKIKTIGDAYMAVCGLPTPVEDHAAKTVQAALEINAFIAQRLIERPHRSFRIRIGINSGDVVAGIVGIKKFAYDIWGDTVNTAARMESNSEPNQINISESTYELVKDKFVCTPRNQIEVKGKGKLQMYFVEGKR